MKFYVPSRMLEHLQDEDFVWLSPAYFNVSRKCISKDGYFGSGYIIEADEGFDTFFTIKTSLQLPIITDQEYVQFGLDNVAFLGKERTRKLELSWKKYEEILEAERMRGYR